MSVQRTSLIVFGAMLVLSAGLAACGGGGGSAGSPHTPPPSTIPSSPSPVPTGSANVADIIFTGDQQQSSFNLQVQTNGSATLITQGQTFQRTVQATHATQLYTDLNAAIQKPGLGALPTTSPCPKPSSFPGGYNDVTAIAYKNQGTPDLSCSSSKQPQTQQIFTDVTNAEKDVMP